MAKRDLVRDTVRNSVLFARHVVPAAVKPARTLWNEVIGFIFLVMAASVGFSAVRAALDFRGDPGTLIKVGFAGVFALIAAYYGITSFRKARRISKS